MAVELLKDLLHTEGDIRIPSPTFAETGLREEPETLEEDCMTQRNRVAYVTLSRVFIIPFVSGTKRS